MSWQDPKDVSYRLDWQHAFGVEARARGMVSAAAAQRYISQLRTMQRRLRRTPEPTWSDWKAIFQKAGSRIRDRWILDRCKKRIDEAIKRGDSSVAMERRNLFDAWRGHSNLRRRIGTFGQRARKFNRLR